jgi:hypothetical protein
MWSAVSITTTQVWEEVLWHATATWRDDDAAEPVVLVLSGRAPLHDLADPTEMLRAAVRAMEIEQETGRVRLRDGASPGGF